MSIKINWPFKELEVGESCTIPAEQARRAKNYVHVYAAQAGKKLSWKSNWDGSIVVTRKPNTVTEAYDLTLEQVDALKAMFGGKEGLKKFAKIVAGAHRVYGTESGTVRFEARNGPVTL